MKYKILFVLLLITSISYCQTFNYPQINKRGNGPQSFIPDGWNVIDSAFGDLNNDKYEDVAYIIQYKDTAMEKRPFGPNKEDIDIDAAIPRMLIVLFKEAGGNLYQLGLQNNEFILRSNEGGIFGDPLEKMEIEKNVLILNFYGGSRDRWGLKYKFRFQQEDWKLIGATNNGYDNLTGEYEDYDYNFLTKKVKITTGNENGKRKKVKWETIKIKELKTFKTFIKPWTWEISKERFL